ncbi:unnamed protein product [Closterium sp. Yama58-4]|nr:unnamed protein product [Closterium sp. Yama58-4]
MPPPGAPAASPLPSTPSPSQPGSYPMSRVAPPYALAANAPGGLAGGAMGGMMSPTASAQLRSSALANNPNASAQGAPSPSAMPPSMGKAGASPSSSASLPALPSSLHLPANMRGPQSAPTMSSHFSPSSAAPQYPSQAQSASPGGASYSPSAPHLQQQGYSASPGGGARGGMQQVGGSGGQGGTEQAEQHGRGVVGSSGMGYGARGQAGAQRGKATGAPPQADAHRPLRARLPISCSPTLISLPFTLPPSLSRLAFSLSARAAWAGGGHVSLVPHPGQAAAVCPLSASPAAAAAAETTTTKAIAAAAAAAASTAAAATAATTTSAAAATTGEGGTGGTAGAWQGDAAHANVEGKKLLGKRTLQELAKQVDARMQLDPEVEEVLLDLADDFIQSVTAFGCQLARHRKSQVLEAKDVLLHLERSWHMRIPGFTGDDYRVYKRPPVTEAHRQRLAAVRRSAAIAANESHASPAVAAAAPGSTGPHGHSAAAAAQAAQAGGFEQGAHASMAKLASPNFKGPGGASGPLSPVGGTVQAFKHH